MLLCMGLFSIFLVGSQSDAGVAARIRLEAAHASEAFAVAKCRTISAQNCEPKVVFPFAVQRIGDFVIELTTRSVF